jgi:hypothetical protein
MRSSSPPVTSSLHHTIANCNVVTIATDCTQSHSASFHLLFVQDIAAGVGGGQIQNQVCLSEETESDNIVLQL